MNTDWLYSKIFLLIVFEASGYFVGKIPACGYN